MQQTRRCYSAISSPIYEFFFTGRFLAKFAVNWLLQIPPYLPYVACTLPCEMLMSKNKGLTINCKVVYLRYGGVANNRQQQQPFNGLFSRTTWVSRYQKGKTNLDFTGARESEWQWHQLGHMQVCTSFHTDNHASTPPLCFLQAVCPSCRPTNSVKALKAFANNRINK